MRLHTSATAQDIDNAAKLARVNYNKYSVHGSRKAPRAFEITLTGESRRNCNDNSGEKAATWDQWGVFLAAIYEVDPKMQCWAYKNAENFHYQTNWRFENGWPEDAHGDHKWEFSYPYENKCRHCKALRRWR